METRKLFVSCLFLCTILFLLNKQSFSLVALFQKIFNFSINMSLTHFDLILCMISVFIILNCFIPILRISGLPIFTKRGGEARELVSGWDHLLLSQKTWIHFLVYTWWFIAHCDSSSWEAFVLLQPHYQTCCAHRYLQTKYYNT